MSECNVVKPVYKGHSREPENVSFIHRFKICVIHYIEKWNCPLYSDLLYTGVPLGQAWLYIQQWLIRCIPGVICDYHGNKIIAKFWNILIFR